MSQTTILTAYWQGGGCRVEFSESGWTVLEDTRDINLGYLHCYDDSAEEITDDCRNQIIRYIFAHQKGLPGVGATPQHRYFRGLNTADIERIGNDGKRAFYANGR